MLDGAASNEKLFAEVARQGMPAVAMTDHGNMFGAYEFFQISKKYDGDQNPLVKPIIGIEAYVAPSTRRNSGEPPATRAIRMRRAARMCPEVAATPT